MERLGIDTGAGNIRDVLLDDSILDIYFKNLIKTFKISLLLARIWKIHTKHMKLIQQGVGHHIENSVDSVIFFIGFSISIILNLSNIITRIIHMMRLKEKSGKSDYLEELNSFFVS